jgi:hypothetical protein
LLAREGSVNRAHAALCFSPPILKKPLGDALINVGESIDPDTSKGLPS